MNQVPTLPKNLSPASIARCSDYKARALIPFKTASKYLILPLQCIKDEELHIALPSRQDLNAIRSIKFLTGRNLKITELPEDVLKEAIYISYQGNEDNLKSCLKVNNQIDEPIKILWGNHDSEVLNSLEALIEYCIAKKASDLHLCPEISGIFARLRIQGDLNSTTKPIFSKESYKTVVRRLKVLASLPISSFEPQDGSFTVPTSIGEISIRISIIPTIHGDKVALRFAGNVQKYSIESLGLSLEIQAELRSALSLKEGMIIVAGPTGSGKTTTLYTLVELLSERPIHVMSVEDPVERDIPFVSQMQVNTDKGVTFASGLKAILRQDPDVILVGEIRDEDTASLCLKAATTGHLVLTTIHSGSIEQAFERFSQLGVARNELLSVCKFVLSQRLIPILCNECKVIDLLESQKSQEKRYKRVGCLVCDYSGFSSRKAICEFAEINNGEVRYPFGSIEDAWSELLKDGSVESP